VVVADGVSNPGPNAQRELGPVFGAFAEGGGGNFGGREPNSEGDPSSGKFRCCSAEGFVPW